MEQLPLQIVTPLLPLCLFKTGKIWKNERQISTENNHLCLTHFTEPQVADDILAAYHAADAAEKAAQDEIDNDRNLQPTIVAVEQEVNTMKETVQNTLNTEQTLTTECMYNLCFYFVMLSRDSI